MAEHDHEHGHQGYQKGSLSLWGAVSLGTGVMIGAGEILFLRKKR